MTDTDEDMDRILITDDSHVKRSSVCEWTTALSLKATVVTRHVSCVNEHMSYKCDCVSRRKQVEQRIGMRGGQMISKGEAEAQKRNDETRATAQKDIETSKVNTS